MSPRYLLITQGLNDHTGIDVVSKDIVKFQTLSSYHEYEGYCSIYMELCHLPAYMSVVSWYAWTHEIGNYMQNLTHVTMSCIDKPNVNYFS